jgi:hypothetical protein
MRQSRLSGSVEGVMGNHDSYSDYVLVPFSPMPAASARAAGQSKKVSATMRK